METKKVSSFIRIQDHILYIKKEKLKGVVDTRKYSQLTAPKLLTSTVSFERFIFVHGCHKRKGRRKEVTQTIIKNWIIFEFFTMGVDIYGFTHSLLTFRLGALTNQEPLTLRS